MSILLTTFQRMHTNFKSFFTKTTKPIIEYFTQSSTHSWIAVLVMSVLLGIVYIPSFGPLGFILGMALFFLAVTLASWALNKASTYIDLHKRGFDQALGTEVSLALVSVAFSIFIGIIMALFVGLLKIPKLGMLIYLISMVFFVWLAILVTSIAYGVRMKKAFALLATATGFLYIVFTGVFLGIAFIATLFGAPRTLRTPLHDRILSPQGIFHDRDTTRGDSHDTRIENYEERKEEIFDNHEDIRENIREVYEERKQDLQDAQKEATPPATNSEDEVGNGLFNGDFGDFMF